MKRLLIAGVALSLMGCALGTRYPVMPHGYVPLPPERYASGPTIKEPIWNYVENPNAVCHNYGTLPEGWGYMACSLPATGDIFIEPNDGSIWWQRAKAHELGHLRGWPGDHPR